MVAIHLDFETRSDVDLRRHGLRRYVKGAAFEVLLSAWASDTGSVEQAEGLPPTSLIEDPAFIFHAFNASFERAVLAAAGYPLPASRFRCTMAHAYSCGFSGTLRDVGEQLGIDPELTKLASGTYLIKKFSTPPFAEPKGLDWTLFREYNRRDVEAERAIAQRLPPWPDYEQKLWELDQQINERGVPVDRRLVHTAQGAAKDMKQELAARCKALTGGIGPSEVGKLLDWCRSQGYPGEDLGAKTIEKYLTVEVDKGEPLG